MANTLRFKRGAASGLPTGLAGEPLFTTDTFDLYIGNGTTNTRFQKYIASGTTSQLLRGDGSLLTMPIVLTSPSNGQVLKFNGTSWVNDSDAGITGSGSAGQVAYFTGATTQGGNNALFWDTTNLRLGIGTNTPSGPLHVVGAGLFTTNINFPNTGEHYLQNLASTTFIGLNFDTPYIRFAVNNSVRATIFSTGNFGINTGATDSGQRLQVIGDTLLRGSGTTNATIGLTVQDSASTNLLRLRNDGSAILRNGLFFGTSTNNYIVSSNASNTVDVAGLNLNILFGSFETAGYGVQIGGYNASTRTVTSGASGTVNIAHGYAPTSGTGTYTMLQVIGTINQTGGANGITRGLYVNPTLTAAADWRSIEWSNNTGWGLYGNGTANNYIAGSLGIGNTSLTGYNLRILKNITGAGFPFNVSVGGAVQSDVTNTATYIQAISSTQATTFTLPQITLFTAEQGTFGAGSTVTNQVGFNVANLSGGVNNFGFVSAIAAATNNWNLYINGTAKNYINGNLLIGSTTDSGEKLQVTGTMKVTGATAFGGNTTLTGAGLMNHTIVSTSTAGYSYMIFKNTGASGREMTLGIGGSTTGNDSNKFFIGDTTAGGAIRMSIDTSGNIGFGTYTPTVISGYTTLAVNNATNGGNIDLMTNGTRHASWNNTATETYFGTRSNTPLAITTNATEVARYFANGNFRVGAAAADSGERLQVTGTAKITGATSITNTMTARQVIVDGANNSNISRINLTRTDASWGIYNETDFRIYYSTGNTTTPATQYFSLGSGTGLATFSNNVIVTGTTTIGTTSTTGYSLVVQNSGANDATGIRLTSGGTDNGYFTTAYNSVSKYAALQAGDNTAYRAIILNGLGGNVGIGMNPSYALDVTGSARISDAIAIGTTPDTNNPFKILKNINSTVGVRFENTNTSSAAFSAIQFGTDVSGGTKFGNLVYASAGVAQTGAYYPDGTSLVNTGSGGLNLLAVSQPIRFFTSSGNGTERVRIKNEGHVRFVPLAAAPTTNVEAGDVYYDSTTNKLRCYNGTSWNDLF